MHVQVTMDPGKFSSAGPAITHLGEPLIWEVLDSRNTLSSTPVTKRIIGEALCPADANTHLFVYGMYGQYSKQQTVASGLISRVFRGTSEESFSWNCMRETCQNFILCVGTIDKENNI